MIACSRSLLLLLAFSLIAAALLTGCQPTTNDVQQSDDDAGHHDLDDDANHGDDDANHGDDDNAPNVDHLIPPTVDDTLQALLEDYVAFSSEPGVAFAARLGDGPIHAHAAGKANIVEVRPLTPDMRFRVGSCTKPFTATVVMQLADEGQLDLDDLMTKYLPQYALWPNVTIRHLLRMQSGIPDYLMSTFFWLWALAREGHPLRPETLVFHAMYQTPEFEPGQGCDYSNTNYVLLGMIIEKVTGRTAAEEIYDRVIEPLGLHHTFLDTAGNEFDELAHGYAEAELAGIALGLGANLMGLIDLIPQEYVVEGLEFDGTYLFHPSFAWTAGALVSTPEDQVRFVKAYYNGDLVSEERHAEMMDFTPCMCVGNPVDYSQGMMRYPTPFGLSYGHGGMYFGYSANTYYIPDIDLAYSLMDNFVPDQSDSMRDELLRAVVQNDASPTPSCEPPAFFDSLPPAYNLQIKFRGQINRPYVLDPTAGVSSTKVLIDDEWRAYYIMGANAALAGLLPSRVEMQTYGPSDTPGFDLRGLVLNVRSSVLDQANRSGVIIIRPDLPDDINLYLSEVHLDENGDGDQVCMTAAPRALALGYLYVCDYKTLDPELGGTLRLFGDFAMDWDENRVKEYAGTLGLAVCECKNAAGVWGPCPDVPEDGGS